MFTEHLNIFGIGVGAMWAANLEVDRIFVWFHIIYYIYYKYFPFFNVLKFCFLAELRWDIAF